MGTFDIATSDLFTSHPILAVLACVVLAVALLLGLLHELALGLEIARFLVIRVKEHLHHVGHATRLLWIELTTWRESGRASAPPTDAPPDRGYG
jgi:hypothetical protein